MNEVGNKAKFNPMTDDNAMELIKEIQELVKTHEEIDDEDVLHVMGYMMRLIRNPDIGPLQAPLLVAQLEALAMKFSIMKTYYTSFGTKEERFKKNMFYTLADKTKDLADAVKYIAR